LLAFVERRHPVATEIVSKLNNSCAASGPPLNSEPGAVATGPTQRHSVVRTIATTNASAFKLYYLSWCWVRWARGPVAIASWTQLL